MSSIANIIKLANQFSKYSQLTDEGPLEDLYWLDDKLHSNDPRPGGAQLFVTDPDATIVSDPFFEGNVDAVVVYFRKGSVYDKDPLKGVAFIESILPKMFNRREVFVTIIHPANKVRHRTVISPDNWSETPIAITLGVMPK